MSRQTIDRYHLMVDCKFPRLRLMHICNYSIISIALVDKRVVKSVAKSLVHNSLAFFLLLLTCRIESEVELKRECVYVTALTFDHSKCISWETRFTRIFYDKSFRFPLPLSFDLILHIVDVFRNP